MHPAEYERLTSDDREEEKYEISEEDDSPSPAALQAKLIRDPRFNQPTPSLWKRLSLLLFIVFLFWLGYSLRTQKPAPAKVVHANRYSKDYKFRPAASPVITERLKDGRVRLRGAQPATTYFR